MKRNYVIAMLVSLGLLAGMVGCSSLSGTAGRRFNRDGLPKSEYLVGGGLGVEYIAPSAGTAYWVEETSKKILQTESVASGEKVVFQMGVEPEEAKRVLGIEIKDARFTVYFIPSEPRS
jgi:hypothetical protein